MVVVDVRGGVLVEMRVGVVVGTEGIAVFPMVTPVLTTMLMLVIAANGSRRPVDSGAIGVVRSTKALKRESEKMSVLNEIAVSSLNSAWNCVCASFVGAIAVRAA